VTTRRWTVVAGQECRDLWLGGRGPALLFGFGVLLSAMTYLAATNRGMNFLEQREAVNLILQVAVAVGVLVTLVVSADAISGERERGTLETLLLAPVSRRAIVTGKLAGAMTLWLGCAVVVLPYLWVLARGVSAFGAAVLLTAAVGSLLAAGLAGLGLLISTRAASNKASVALSLLVMLALFAPTQLPALPTTSYGDLLLRVNPLGAGMHYISAVTVGQHGWTRDLSYLVSPAVTAVLAIGVLVVAAPRIVRLRPS
jgi:ABC-2 type transport system permease protein